MSTTPEPERAMVAGNRFTPAQVQLLKDTVCRGATDDEMALFLVVCARTRLDPFTRQIHFVKRFDSALNREVAAFQVGIDGYRKIAQDTGEYAGQDPKEWCGPEGEWCDVWLDEEAPFAARARVYRHGIERPFVAVARFKAYFQRKSDNKPNYMWSRMDAEQLAKCAEALALRMGFPNELSDIYTHDEMAHIGEAEIEAPSTDQARIGPGMAGLREKLGVGGDASDHAGSDAIAKSPAGGAAPRDQAALPDLGLGRLPRPMCSRCSNESSVTIDGVHYCDADKPGNAVDVGPARR